jgi:hypothetical protein
MAKTFWEITKESKIEIPEIQRDYAQGRVDDRVKSIRKGFVSSLLDAVNEGKELSLDFIFGQSVDRTNQANFNKDKQSLEQMLQVLAEFSTRTGVNFESKVSAKPVASSDDKLLIPFDGQQRLTTLFLLHLFIGGMAKKDISNLSSFSYKTRESSTLFIEQLIANLFGVINDIDNLLSYNIKNQSWFFSSWEKDPTVSGMLVMLDEIKNQAEAKSLDYEKAWINLTENNSISFDYFDIQEEGFDEDLYVKMNARGKGLTDFENFRAWLEKKYKGSIDLDKEWFKKVDKEWLDLFWRSKEEVKDVDENFLAFFKNMALLVKMGSSELGVANSNTGTNLITLLNPKIYTPTSDYQKHNIFNKHTLDFIFKILDIFSNDKENKINEVISSVWTKTFTDKGSKGFTNLILTNFDGLNLSHKSFAFAVLKYLYVRNKDIQDYSKEDYKCFNDWLRVVRNLIYNTTIDNVDSYIQAIISVNNFESKDLLDISNKLGQDPDNEDKRWMPFFSLKQEREEVLKNKILSKGSKWKELIDRAENNIYFYGQIKFIFDISSSDIVQFESYFIKLDRLFTKSNIESKSYILQCLFLAFDDTNQWLEAKTVDRYKFYKSALGTSRDRNENWRVLFNDANKRKILKDVLDTIDCSLESIRNLIDIKYQECSFDNWKYLILDKPEMLANCRDSLLTIRDDYKVFRLLEKSQNYSRQRELRSFHYYNVLIEENDGSKYSPFTSIGYFTGERNNFNPCFIFDNWKYKSCRYYIDCLFASNNFEIKLGTREAIGTTSLIDVSVKELLQEKLNFLYNEETKILSLTGVLYSGLEKKLEEVFTMLKEIK